MKWVVVPFEGNMWKARYRGKEILIWEIIGGHKWEVTLGKKHVYTGKPEVTFEDAEARAIAYIDQWGVEK